MSQEMHLQPLDSSLVPRFAEVATFMRTPAVPLSSALDVGLLGVPLDIGITYRTGPRQGPSQIREMSRLIRQVNPTTKIAPFRLCEVGDIGDAPVNPLDLLGSVEMIAQHFALIRQAGVLPIAAGGDHTITYPILKGLVAGEPVGVIQFDSHSDTLDELLGTRINHATTFRRGVEDGLIDPRRMVQIGLRGTRYGDDDIQFALDAGMRVIEMDEYEALGREAVIAEIRRVVGDQPVYISFDVDGLDPVYAPGTGVPEPGGLSMRDSQMILRSLMGLHLIGADVCEVAPALDPSGMTALNAANLMFEMLCIAAGSIARRKGRLPA